MRENRAAYCFNTTNRQGSIDYEIYGKSEMEPSRFVEISLRPCVPEVRSIATHPNAKCIIEDNSQESYDKKMKEIKEYIGQPNLHVLMNR